MNTDPARICSQPRTNGHLCKSPALHGKRLCFYHQRDHDRRARLDQNLDHRRSCIASGNFYQLHQMMPDGKTVYDDNSVELFQALQAPLFDDGNAIQVQLSTLFHAIATQQVSYRAAGLLLFNLQIASSNLKNTRPPDWDRERSATEDIEPIHAMPEFETMTQRMREKTEAMRQARSDENESEDHEDDQHSAIETKKAATGVKR